MKYDFIIFGGTGEEGGICARDLLESGYSVMLVGRNKSRIGKLLKNKKTGFLRVDLRNETDIAKAIRKSNADVVVNCSELVFNVAIMRACLKTKKPITDLGGLQKITIEQFKLHTAFRKAGIINITGCGSTPGIVNVMAKYSVEKFDSVDTITLGFAWDSNIKKFVVPYSIQSIFHEFTENPVTYHDGKFVREKRMVCRGDLKFKEIGLQTVYCIVHSEVYSFSKYFRHKGLKTIHYMAGFPEHSIKPIQMMIDLDFNSEEPINMGGEEIKPVNFTTAVLRKLQQPKGYKEVENLWIKIYGKKDSRNVKTEMNCIVKTLPGWEDAGSNVDTGRTISIMSQMLKKGVIKEKGVYAPEAVIPCEPFFKELSRRKMYVYENNRKIN